MRETRTAGIFITPEYCRAVPVIQPLYSCSPALTDKPVRLPAELLLETQSSIERGCDVDHVYGLEEFMPGRGSTESHPSRGVLPYRHHDTGQVGGGCAPLERLLNPRLLRRRSFSKRPVDRNDDQFLTVSPQMCYLKGRHCIHWSCRRFRHVPWRIQPANEMVNVDSISPNCLFSINKAVGAF
jgi:hypothetical protein